jgi:hypothetical protein
LSVSPGESLTAVLGPGGFGRGGCVVWQPPHASATKTTKAARQEDGLNASVRRALLVSDNCRLSHMFLLFCVMQGCLLYKIVGRQDKMQRGRRSAFRGKKVLSIVFNDWQVRWKGLFYFSRHCGIFECARVAFGSGPRRAVIVSRLSRFVEFWYSIDAQNNLIRLPDHKTQKKMSVRRHFLVSSIVGEHPLI